MEPGVNGNRSDARPASGDDHARAELRHDARGNI